jgi:hypothetical protein
MAERRVAVEARIVDEERMPLTPTPTPTPTWSSAVLSGHRAGLFRMLPRSQAEW